MSPKDRPAVTSRGLLGLAQGTRLYAGLALLILAVASIVASLMLFPREPSTTAAWTTHLAGIVLFAAAVVQLFRRPSEFEPAEPLTLQVLMFGLIILGLAIFLRFYRLDELPFGTWYDEADIGLQAERILLEPFYRPAYLTGHALAYYFPALVALSFKLVGVGTLAVRTVTVLFGLGSVVLAFFVGREIYGNRFGLLMAFFFAVARWAITFDRLGMATSSGPFFVLLVLLLLLYGRRAKDVRAFAWAGLVAGLGLGFHASLRLFPLVILVLMAYWISRQWRRRPEQQGWRVAWSANLALLFVGGALAAGPLIQVAVRQPDDFWRRTREVSIFETRDEPNVVRAIASNTIKNALMFNYQGDRNGRHNLPGEPTLDPVTGALFLFGLALAITRFRRQAELLFLVIMVVGLVAAILTLDFEAPQAQRAVGAMAAVFFFAALAVEAYWRVLDGSTTPFWARPLGVLLLLAGGATIVYSNTNNYFVRQANSNAVWEAHSTIETLAANNVAKLGSQGDSIYLSMYLQGHPVIDFLAPGIDTAPIIGPDILPLREASERPVAVVVDVREAWIAEAIDAFYADAQLSVDTNLNGLPIVYTVVVPPDDIRQPQGLRASYWPGSAPEGEPKISRVEKMVDARWPAQAPLSAPFVAQWEGVLYAPDFGEYQLQLSAPGPAALWLDGQQVIHSDAGGEQRLARTLAEGNHALRLQVKSGDGQVRLAWIRPTPEQEAETIPARDLYYGPMVTSQGLLGRFYEDADWQSEPALERIDPFIDAYFHLIPLPRPYGVIWSGQIEIPETGLYAFGLEVNGQAKLFVDEQLVVDAPQPTPYQEATVSLEAGRHELRLQFLDDVGGSLLRLYWTPPGQEQQIIPAEVLYPFAPGD